MREQEKKETKVAAVIVAAGQGKRFGGAKQFAFLAGRRVVEWAIDVFASHPEVDEVVVVLPDERLAEEIKSKWAKVKAVVRGGEERQDSVARGLEAVSEEMELVLVHDGVRPLVSPELISQVIRMTCTENAVIPVLPIEETTKLVENGTVFKTLDRAGIVRVQTPQGFKKALLEAALTKAYREGYYGPDEASLVERMGEKVTVIPGERKNIKITVPEDLKIAEVWIDESRHRL